MKNVDFDKILKEGETQTVEFKSWIRAGSMKERIKLAVDELIAFANADGGTVYMGVEDDGEVTGCTGNYDKQNIIEAIYDKTRPPLFTSIEEFQYNDRTVIAISVEKSGQIHTTNDGRCLKRLGKNSKPFYPSELTGIYSDNRQNSDFSAKIADKSSLDDIDFLEVQKLKDRMRLRDPQSTLPDENDKNFLADLGFTRVLDSETRVTIAGLLFAGKGTSIEKYLPQAEVIYLRYSKENPTEYNARIDMKQPIITVLDRLTEVIQNTNTIENVQIGLFRLEIADYSEKVFQEALLNALSHRDYESSGAVYVKHYADRIVIENPGGFPADITAKNIITHPSIPRNKLIAETLQRLKYVQRAGQGVDIIYQDMLSMGKAYPQYRAFSDAISLTLMSAMENKSFVKFIVNEQEQQQKIFDLSELMIMRYLADNKKVTFSEACELTQSAEDVVRKNINELTRMGLIETAGKSYMLTARVYSNIKSEVEYIRDKDVSYIKARGMILEYLERNKTITSGTIQEMCGFTKQQARTVLEKMQKENILVMEGHGRGAYYVIRNG